LDKVSDKTFVNEFLADFQAGIKLEMAGAGPDPAPDGDYFFATKL